MESNLYIYIIYECNDDWSSWKDDNITLAFEFEVYITIK
jgi:hypothetical protein